MKGIMVKSMPYGHAMFVKTPPEVPDVIPKEDREWNFITCVKYPPAKSLRISTRIVKVSRHSPNLRESDGATLWNTRQHCRSFEEAVNWPLEDWKTCLEHGTDKIRFEYCLDRKRQIQYMRSVRGHSGGQQIDPRLQNNVHISHGLVIFVT